MPIYKVQMTMPHDSGLAEDSVVNSLHVAIGEGSEDEATYANVADKVSHLIKKGHSNAGGLMGSVGQMLSAELTGSINVKLYKAEQAAPNFPVYTDNFTFVTGTTGEGGLPSEVAIVGSYSAAKVSGQDPARRRGRLYFGPLSTAATALVAGRARPTQNARDRIIAAFTKLKADSDASTTWEWVTWSAGARQRVLVDGKLRAQGPLLPPTNALVTNWWVDDAFDTQRRRGARPTLKQTTVAGLVLTA